MLRLDAAENRFLITELEHIEAEGYKDLLPELKYAQLIPTVTGYDPGAAKHAYKQLHQVGRAKVVSNKSKDLPRVDLYATKHSQDVLPIADSFGYDVYEIKGAAKAGVPLERERAMTAREAVFRELEQVAALGDSTVGLSGLCDHDDVTADTAPNGAAGTATWATKTPEEIVKDLNALCLAIINGSSGVDAPNAVLIPEGEYARIATTQMTGVDTTVLKFFMGSHPTVKEIMPWHFLSTAGASSAQRMVAYKKDPKVLELRNPHGYEQLEPVLQGLEYLVACHMSTAGVILRRPNAVRYMDGI